MITASALPPFFPRHRSAFCFGAHRAIFQLCVLLLLASLCTACHYVPTGGIQLSGLRNFHRVDDDLFRGAQPDSEGLARLYDQGIRTVINLREADDDWNDEERVTRSLGMDYFQIPMAGIGRPTEAQVNAVLKIIKTTKSPVFVHCRRGADRTGTIIACYRMRHDGWTPATALKEAESNGMSWVQFGMKDFVREFSAITKP